jgi:hypothetical protein
LLFKKTFYPEIFFFKTGCWTTDGRALFLGFHGYEGEIHVLSISPNFDYEWLPKIDLSPIPEWYNLNSLNLIISIKFICNFIM